jgi:hypothetical protein
VADVDLLLLQGARTARFSHRSPPWPSVKQSNTLYRHSVEIPATTEINKKTDLNIALEPLEAMTPFGG